MRSSGKRDVSTVSEAIVLAGGLGTRLRPVVADVPKPMASVAGRPFLSYVLEFLERQGIQHVILSVGYRHEMISSFFGARCGAIQLDYAIEQEALGTGGGIANALQFANESFVFALNGDTFLRLEYPAMARLVEEAEDFKLAVALREVQEASRYSRVVVSDGRIQDFTAAGTPGPGLINAGVYLMSRRLFEHSPVPKRFSFEADFLEARVSEIRPLAFACDAPFIDIGVPESLAASQTLLPAWTRQ